MATDSERQQKRYQKLIDAGLKCMKVWIGKDDKEAEKRVKAEDRREEVE